MQVTVAVSWTCRDHPEIKQVRVEGHTDNVGHSEYNKALSTRRAASVVEWLVKKGSIERARLTSAGFGREKPIDDNKTSVGRRNNRRVEFHIVDGPSVSGGGNGSAQ